MISNYWQGYVTRADFPTKVMTYYYYHDNYYRVSITQYIHQLLIVIVFGSSSKIKNRCTKNNKERYNVGCVFNFSVFTFFSLLASFP